jgi:hypothetical protein
VCVRIVWKIVHPVSSGRVRKAFAITQRVCKLQVKINFSSNLICLMVIEVKSFTQLSFNNQNSFWNHFKWFFTQRGTAIPIFLLRYALTVYVRCNSSNYNNANPDPAL